MSHPVTKERIDKFWQDRRLLPYDDVVIAERMQKDKSNYSKSVNEGPITNGFLRKFYAVFGEELKELMQDHVPNDIVSAPTQFEYWSGLIQKMNNTVRDLVESNYKLAESNYMLAKSNHNLAGSIERLVDAHISALDYIKKPDGQV